MSVAAYNSERYFIWTVNSTICQQFSVQCAQATAAQNVSASTLCSIRHTADYGLPTTDSIPFNTQHHLPYTNPGIVHYFEFSARLKDHLLIMESIKIGELSEYCYCY